MSDDISQNFESLNISRENTNTAENIDQQNSESGGGHSSRTYIPQPPLMATATSKAVSSKSRLILQKLTLVNFKSYAGTVEIGPFHKSFSSVVGPNGSGKSNVIDSLLFVFGFKAKKLRQGKLKDLIHSSASYPDLDFCQVQVHFALMNDETDSIVPNSSFVVSRSVKKSIGGSESSSYAIDGKTSSYSKVQDLLKGYGVDLEHKRFLILQGEVESISLMKPKGQTEGEDGLLEYLEDIIGTTGYAEPIKEATAALDALTEVYETHLVKFKHAQKDTLGLKEKSQEAIAFIEWENNVARLNNTVLQLKIHNSNVESSKINLEMEKWNEEVKQLEESQSGHTMEVSQLEQDMKAIQDTVNGFSVKAAAARKNLNEFESLMVSHKETEKHLLQKKKKLSKALVEEKRQKSEDQSWISNFETDTTTAKNDAQKLKEKLDKEVNVLADIQEGLRDKTQGLQTQIESLQLKLDPYLERINSISSQIGVASHERGIVDQAVNGGRVAFEEAQAAHQSVLKRVLECRKDLQDANQKLDESKTQVSQFTQKIKALEKEIKLNESQLQGARSSLSDAKLTMESNESRGKVYSTIMAHASSGKLGTTGVLGRLGNLGSIDEKYDVAITTCASGSLDSIVVERVEDAQICIAFLKKHQLGRANFLCLDKMRKGGDAPFKAPARSQRLFDLVKMKQERFRDVFYHALGDTLVTDNLDIANQVAYSHGGGGALFRVVTLTGQVIEKSGAMSGGGARVLKGGMSKSGAASADAFTPKQVEELENRVSLLIESRDSLQSELDSVSLELESFQCLVLELENQVSKLNLEKDSLKTEVKETEASLNVAKQTSAPDPADLARLKELDTLLAKLDKQLQEPQTAASSLQAQVKSLQDEIMQIGGVRLRSQHAKVESLQDQIQALQKKLAKLVAEKGMREKNLLKLAKNLEKKECELESVDTEMERIVGLVQESLDASSSVREQVRDLTDELENAQEKLKDLKSVLAEKTSDANRARSIVMELKAKVSAHKATLSLNKNRVKQWENELKQLSLSMTGFDELDKEIGSLETFTIDQLDEMNLKKSVADLEKIKTHFTGNLPNLAVLQEYRKKMEVYQERSAAVEQAGAERDEKKNEYDRLRKERLDTFMAGFTAISQKLKEMYQMITMGGNAELELVDSLDPFSEGVLFSVMPPKKSWKNIANLSGGEKTLSSLALVFALHHFKPTPLYVMDEIDAALDFRNVSIIANYIKQRTRNAQFVIISLRNNMFELADRLVGIYKTDNTSKSITINPSEVEEMSRNVLKTPSAVEDPPLHAAPIA